MRTKHLFGSVAAIALFGTAAMAQDVTELDEEIQAQLESGELVEQPAGTGFEVQTNDAGEDVVINTQDQTELSRDQYRIDENGEVLLLVRAEEAQAQQQQTAQVDVEGQAALGGGEFVVEQGEPRVRVNVPDPTIRVDQAEPIVRVEQPTPEVTVEVPPPTVNVEQQQPVITVEQQQPIVTVRIPEPIVTIQLAEPEVQVAQGDADVDVEVPQPRVQFVQPEPQIRVQQAEAQVEVAQAEPQVDIERTQQADVQIEQAEAEVSIEETGEAEVNVTEAEPQVQVEQAEAADVQVEQEGEAQVEVDQAEAEVEVVDQAEVETREIDQAAVAELETDGYIVSADTQETEEVRTQRIEGYSAYADMTAADLVGTDVIAADGEEVGEIDNLAMIGDRLVAIVGIGGFLGIGEHDVALPLERLAMDGESMVADGLTADRFQNFPAYDEANAEVVPADGRIGDLFE